MNYDMQKYIKLIKNSFLSENKRNSLIKMLRPKKNKK